MKILNHFVRYIENVLCVCVPYAKYIMYLTYILHINIFYKQSSDSVIKKITEHIVNSKT